MSGKNELSEGVLNKLTEVIGEIVEKKVEEAIDKRVAANGNILANSKGSFKLPKSDGYKAPEGE